MPSKLPTKLKKEPLVDVVFEIRFSARVPASNILPGTLYDKLDGDKIIEQMPAAQLPKQMRDADPNLQFAPLVRIYWKEYIVLISDKSVALGCKMPYPGWTNFKKAIIQVVNVLAEVKTIEAIQRYSLKYVDIMPFTNVKEQVSSVNFKVTLGNHSLEKEPFQFRIEIPGDGFINAVQIVASVVVTSLDNTVKQGLIVDIDTICNVPDQRAKDFITGLEEKLNKMHSKNKAMFFECITPSTLAVLEPSYD